MKKETNKIKNDRQIVVLEDINSKFSLILEQYSGIRKEIKDNHKEFLGFADRTDKNLKIALEYLFRINEEIQDMKTEIKNLKNVLKEKADLDRLEIVEKRLIKLEKLVFAKLS